MKPAVDLVVAVHDTSRPIERAVASVRGGPVRTTVVCHGIGAEGIERRLADAGLLGDDVRVVELADGVPSPAGPFNHGLDLATADLVGVMGSDDFLEPGALAAWSRLADRGAAVVLGRLRHQSGEAVHAPLVRPWRRSNLDMVRDRLAYRTAPLGLLRRRVLEDGGLRFTPGLRSGEDLALSARLWTGGHRIDLASRAPAYVIGADASSRTSTTAMPLEIELAPVRDLRGRPWLAEVAEEQRTALTVKILRVHLLAAALRRPEPTSWGPGEREHLARETVGWLAFAPHAPDPLARADRDLLDVVVGAHDDHDLADGAARRRAAGRRDEILTRGLRHVLDRESTLRRYLTYRLR